MGGIARRVRWIRENVSSAKRSLLLEAGDGLFKSTAAAASKQVEIARLLLDVYKDLQYDAIAVGRRDLAAGVDFLKQELAARGLTGLSLNLFVKGTRVFKPYKTFDWNGTRIAVIGVTAPDSGRGPLPDGAQLSDPLPGLKEVLDEIKAKAKITILLSNLGVNQDQALLKSLKGIDIIIGSGAGGPLYRPIQAGATWIVRSHSKGRSVGVLEIRADEGGELNRLDNRLVLLAGELPEDVETAKKISPFAEAKTSVTPAKLQPPSEKLSEDNPFLKALKQKIEEQKKTGRKPAPPAAARTPMDPDSNPLLELLKRLKEQQQKSQAQEAAPQGATQ